MAKRNPAPFNTRCSLQGMKDLGEFINKDKSLKKRVENLGFEKIESEYLLYDVYYVPYVYMPKKITSKENIDRIMFDYYLMNCGEKQVRERCKIIR